MRKQSNQKVEVGCNKMFLILLFLLLMERKTCLEIIVDTNKIINTVDEKFVSVAMDTGVMRRHWKKFNSGSAKVRFLAKALSPSYLRFGGTDADTILFEEDSAQNKNVTKATSQTGLNKAWDIVTQPYIPDVQIRSKRDIGYVFPGEREDTNFTMTGHLYDELYSFASAAGFDLVFDLNELLRDGDRWYSGNAHKLMEYTKKKGYHLAGWELGNEPNAYFHQWERRIEPDQLAADFKTLKQMASNFTTFQNRIILGPSTTQLNKKSTIKYFREFLESGGGDAVTCVCFHQYYVNARTATVDQFIDHTILNSLVDEITTGYGIKNKTTKNTQLWLGETSSAWGGGAEGLSDTYVAGFMWLDKLGVAAMFGVDVIARNAFYGGHYALIDSHTHDPLPDYWLTLLYKKLVGRHVLSVSSPSFKGKLRAYAHCVNTRNSDYKPGGIVVYAMNLNSYNVSLTFPDLSHSEDYLHVYILQPENDDLQSSTVLLNGSPLMMLSHTQLPPLLPRKQKPPCVLPAFTFGFFVIPDANVEACL